MHQNNKSPEEIQEDVSEVVQRLEKGKKEAEELAQKYKKDFENMHRKKGNSRVAQTVFGAKIRDTTNEDPFAEDEELSAWTGGASRPTIGETSIST